MRKDGKRYWAKVNSDGECEDIKIGDEEWPYTAEGTWVEIPDKGPPGARYDFVTQSWS